MNVFLRFSIQLNLAYLRGGLKRIHLQKPDFGRSILDTVQYSLTGSEGCLVTFAP